MENKIDTLKIKIDEARKLLPAESKEAIDSVNWKLTILEMNKKYNEEQLENLEMETELLLCGILNPEDYLKEIEIKMGISKEEATTLVNEMDKLVFQKIQTEFEKRIRTGDKENFSKKVLEEEIPFPPYKQTETTKPIEQQTITKNNSTEPVTVTTSIQEKPKSIIPEQIKDISPLSTEKAEASNILEQKLTKPTTTTETVSTYSNTKTDPYREQF